MDCLGSHAMTSKRSDPDTESGGLGGKIHGHVVIVSGGCYCTRVNLLCIHVYHVVHIHAMLMLC